MVKELLCGEEGGWDCMVKIPEMCQIWVGKRLVYTYYVYIFLF